MKIETLDCENVDILFDFINELATHHNNISSDFNGIYPKNPVKYTLQMMAQKIKEGISKIYIIRENNEVVGFTQCTVEQNDIGIIEYLFVSPHCRNNGYGKMLMERTMEHFENENVKDIHIEVVYGNDGAKRFYQQYGFKLQSEVLSLVKMQRHTRTK